VAKNVLDQIRALEEQKQKLLNEAREAALANANAAIAELNELGFNYRLVDGSGTRTPSTRTSTGTRRSGIRDNVFEAVKKAGADGITRATLLEQLGVKGEKSGEQSVSNALSALNKAQKITLANGVYTAA
jgi:hypothetical protein